jgi:hypothetical protein
MYLLEKKNKIVSHILTKLWEEYSQIIIQYFRQNVSLNLKTRFQHVIPSLSVRSLSTLFNSVMHFTFREARKWTFVLRREFGPKRWIIRKNGDKCTMLSDDHEVNNTQEALLITTSQRNMFPRKRLNNNNEARCFLRGPCQDVISCTSLELQFSTGQSVSEEKSRKLVWSGH